MTRLGNTGTSCILAVLPPHPRVVLQFCSFHCSNVLGQGTGKLVPAVALNGVPALVSVCTSRGCQCPLMGEIPPAHTHEAAYKQSQASHTLKPVPTQAFLTSLGCWESPESDSCSTLYGAHLHILLGSSQSDSPFWSLLLFQGRLLIWFSHSHP